MARASQTFANCSEQMLHDLIGHRIQIELIIPAPVFQIISKGIGQTGKWSWQVAFQSLTALSLEHQNRYLYCMTIEQKKIALIYWMTNLDDEATLDQIAGIQKSSLDELPGAIVELLKIADSEPEERLTQHTSVRDIIVGDPDDIIHMDWIQNWKS